MTKDEFEALVAECGLVSTPNVDVVTRVDRIDAAEPYEAAYIAIVRSGVDARFEAVQSLSDDAKVIECVRNAANHAKSLDRMTQKELASVRAGSKPRPSRH